MNNEFKTPRFVLAGFFSVTTTCAYLFSDKMSAEQYITVMGLILSLYGAIAYMRNKNP